MRTPFIAANWKMYKTVHEAVVFVKEFRTLVKDIIDVEIVVAPLFTALHAVAEAARSSIVGVGAQNLHWEREGAFTGEVSAAMVREAGFCLLALTPAPDAVAIQSLTDAQRSRPALLLGAEGTGLSARAMAAADARVVIPMCRGVDSLNVAAAAAVAFWELSRTR